MSVAARAARHHASSSFVFINALAPGPRGILVDRPLAFWIIIPFFWLSYMKIVLIIFAMIFHIIWMLENTADICLSI